MSSGSETRRRFSTHGSGIVSPEQLGACGENVIFESEVLIFHPENILLGSNVYIGHRTILKGYHQNTLTIGSNTWIGQGCFIHAGGGVIIEEDVGIGPNVTILTSQHENGDLNRPIIAQPLVFAPVTVKYGADIGVGAILLPGVTIGAGAVVGAGSIVTKDVAPNSIVAGNPAKLIRHR